MAFTITKEETALHYTGPTLIPNGQNVSFSGLLKEDDVVPIAGRTVTITISYSVERAPSCAGVTNAAGVATCSILVSQPLGPGLPIHAEFAGDAFYLPSSDDATALVFAFLDHGTFAVGDGNAAIGTAVTFWGARWAADNMLSGGSAPASFKGFAGETKTTPPSCGTDYKAKPRQQRRSTGQRAELHGRRRLEQGEEVRIDDHGRHRPHRDRPDRRRLLR